MTGESQRSRTLRVTAAIIRRAATILLARRREGAHLAGFWEFPGGKIEDSESPEECLARELREEFHLEATVGRFVASSRYSYPDREIELVAYEVQLAPGPIVLNDHDEIQWVPVAELLRYNLAPADVPIAEAIAHKSRHERDVR